MFCNVKVAYIIFLGMVFTMRECYAVEDDWTLLQVVTKGVQKLAELSEQEIDLGRIEDQYSVVIGKTKLLSESLKEQSKKSQSGGGLGEEGDYSEIDTLESYYTCLDECLFQLSKVLDSLKARKIVLDSMGYEELTAEFGRVN